MDQNLENTLFPIGLGLHVVLALAALLVFGLQFMRLRKSHHLILAVALPCTLLPYLDENNQTLFYGVGIAELLALVLALVLSMTIDREKRRAVQTAASAKAASETAEEAEEAEEAEKAEEAPEEPEA